MKKILISIKEDTLFFTYRTSISKDQNNLLNTNIISDSELVFSEEYILKNHKIISLFIKELCVEKNIHSATVSKNELAKLILRTLRHNEHITKFVIKENTNITYEICEEITLNKYIKLVDCFSIPTFMLELLDKYNIKVESRSETFFISNFMVENNLQQFSKIYYKTSIRFTLPLSEEDVNDFKSFCKINRYLKNIHFDKFDNYDLDTIIDIIKDNKMKNLKIIIHDDTNSFDNIEYLKKLNKTYKNSSKLCFKISYSDSYLKENIFKQVILNTLKICGLIILLLVFGIIAYVTISNYTSMKELSVIQDDINKVMKKSKKEQNLIDYNIEDSDQIVDQELVSLLSINSDVYGWLTVKDTNIDYPVVKATDNDYYLTHNLYKEKDKNGWIFMDYRNSKTSEISQNTIIYGHNMYYSGVMFGTLHNAYKKSWYTNEENQIIHFSTLYKDLKFKIFSIYKIPKTSDYLITNFNSEDSFIEFTNMLKERSVYDFKVDINGSDKMLTLSTCTGENSRLVIHAKLITE